MKNKLLKMLTVVLAVCSLFSMSSMLTQDELGEVHKRTNQLIEMGVSKEEVEKLMDGITDWQEAVKILDNKIAEVLNGSSTPSTSTAPAPAATPKPKHEHKYSAKLTKDPTCNEDGTLTYTCDCGDTYEEPVAKLEHNYVESVTKEPTCTTDGEKTFKCSLCGDSYTEVIAAKGHTDGHFTVTTEPTCTESGEKTIYCSVCSEPIRTETIEATGHENTYVNTVNPGFFTPGREEVTCMKCYEVLETKEIPVPMWQYIVAGSVAALVLIAAITVLVIKAKHKEK